MLLTACNSTPDVDLSTIEITLTTEEVKTVYSQKCSSCHGQILADGMPGDLEGIGSEFSREQLGKIVLRGIGLMPGGLVEDEEAAALVEWLSNMK